MPKQYRQLLKLYNSDRALWIKQEDDNSEMKDLKARVPQGSALGHDLYLTFSSDILELMIDKIATFADNTAILE